MTEDPICDLLARLARWVGDTNLRRAGRLCWQTLSPMIGKKPQDLGIQSRPCLFVATRRSRHLSRPCTWIKALKSELEACGLVRWHSVVKVKVPCSQTNQGWIVRPCQCLEERGVPLKSANPNKTLDQSGPTGRQQHIHFPPSPHPTQRQHMPQIPLVLCWTNQRRLH